MNRDGRHRSTSRVQRACGRQLRSSERPDRFQRTTQHERRSGRHGRPISTHRAHSTKAQKPVELKIEEIALGYQQQVGFQLDNKYCARCHNPESTPERVSNYDNLEVKPHPFTEGDTLNKMSDAELTAIISHGGPALNKSRIDAALRLYSEQDRDRGVDCVHSPDLRSSLSCSGMVYAQK